MSTNSKPEILLARLPPNTIYPPFLEKLKLLVKDCGDSGKDFYAVSGLRTFQEQMAIYAQGRTAPCSQCVAKGIKVPCKHIISKAIPGYSAHQYGIAVDFCLDNANDKSGLQPNWDAKQYQILGDMAQKIDLEAGVNWKSFKDAPHIQLPLSKYKIGFSKLLSIYKLSGVPGVWKFLDGFSW